jgi:SAM-dependent methyltransferase
MSRYIQYGCGLSAPKNWVNFDASPTLRIQKIPVAGQFISPKLNVLFPENVRYGDITKGLPGISDNSCSGVYCSHVLEHLSLQDFRKALFNTFKILKPNGIFRCVVPDIEHIARKYIENLNKGQKDASINFIKETLLGVEKRNSGFKGIATAAFGNSHHLWMWDHYSLAEEIIKVGFRKVRRCTFNDSEDVKFKEVEDPSRFFESAAIEAIK